MPDSIRRFGRTAGLSALALGIGAGGGALFTLLNVPLAWMLGAMSATTVAALCGLKIHVDRRLRGLFVAILGVLLGSAFNAELLSRLPGWSLGIMLLAAYIPFVSGLCYLFLRRVGGFDHATAYFSASPGGLSEMMLVGEAMGGNALQISLAHATRILIVVLLIPLFFKLTGALDGAAAVAGPAGPPIAHSDAGILVACGLIGCALGTLLRLPAAWFLGPLFVSAGVHIIGITQSHPPPAVVALAQVAIGAAVGSRFSDLDWRVVAHTLLMAAATTGLMLLATFCISYGVAHATGMPAESLVLALAPGGLVEMALMALALGIDVAYVSAMHVVRLGLVIIFVPLAFRLLRRLRQRKGDVAG